MIRSYFIALIMLVASYSYGMQEHESVKKEQKKIALSFDIDDVISGGYVGVSDYITLMPRIVFWHPSLLGLVLPGERAAFRQKVCTIQEEVNGGSNVLSCIVDYLKDEGYGDLSAYKHQLLIRSQKPQPVMPMIEHIKRLKKKGYTIVGATNQDYLHHQAYRAYMLTQHGIDLNALFDGVMTVRVNDIEPPAGSGLYYHPSGNIYVMREKGSAKPKASYYNGVKDMVKNINPAVETIIYTDDKLENVQGADKAGLQGVHFNLAGGLVHNTSADDLQKTVTAWEVVMREKGVDL